MYLYFYPISLTISLSLSLYLSPSLSLSFSHSHFLYLSLSDLQHLTCCLCLSFSTHIGLIILVCLYLFSLFSFSLSVSFCNPQQILLFLHSKSLLLDLSWYICCSDMRCHRLLQVIYVGDQLYWDFDCSRLKFWFYKNGIHKNWWIILQRNWLISIWPNKLDHFRLG